MMHTTFWKRPLHILQTVITRHGNTNTTFPKTLSCNGYSTFSWKWSCNNSRSDTGWRVTQTEDKIFVQSAVAKAKLIGERNLATMSGKGPGLIVFDLDCTLWPHHVDTTVNPPFKQEGSKVLDQDGVTITYYPEVPKVLEYLKSEGYDMAAASRTTKPPGAYQLLDFFDWTKYFKFKEIYPGSKVTHFMKFVEQAKIPHNEMLFFDDEQRNIIDMEKEGVKCVLVRDGVNMQLVKDSIDKFKNGSL